jgi:hypothetical protein
MLDDSAPLLHGSSSIGSSGPAPTVRSSTLDRPDACNPFIHQLSVLLVEAVLSSGNTVLELRTMTLHQRRKSDGY